MKKELPTRKLPTFVVPQFDEDSLVIKEEIVVDVTSLFDEAQTDEEFMALLKEYGLELID